MMIVRSRAPLRLSFAGGGSDLPAYYEIHGGAVLNASVDIYAYCTIEEVDNKIIFEAADLEVGISYDLQAEIKDCPLKLHQGIYNRMIKDFNNGKPLSIAVKTYCDAPVGSGLGSSSTLSVAIIKAYAEYLKLPLGEYEIANLAWSIERQDLGLNGGKQDQYASTFGGLNFIEFFEDNRVIVNPLRLKPNFVSELESSLVLYFTGKSRESGMIIDEHNKNFAANDKASLEAIHGIKRLSVLTKESLLKSDIKSFAKNIEESWFLKKSCSSRISNPHIESIYDTAKTNGAIGGKVSGAGGGGFMMFIVEPTQRMHLIKSLEDRNDPNGFVLNCHLTPHGGMSWVVDAF
jgi:D-glycero-alpha-D-manno-heptose-7-phosphate kinase